jgi:thioredoxin 1
LYIRLSGISNNLIFFVMTINELATLSSRNRLLLVDFYATWCGPCRDMEPIIKNVERQCGNSVDVLRVDIDQYESVSLVQHFRIMSVPTLLLFRRGRILWRSSGVLSQESIVEVIRRFDRVEVY